MDKIEKALQKLTLEERERIKEILKQLKSGKTSGLNIKKLKGREDIFRVRKGNIRIIYRKDEKSNIFLLSIERRGDNTYR